MKDMIINRFFMRKNLQREFPKEKTIWQRLIGVLVSLGAPGNTGDVFVSTEMLRNNLRIIQDHAQTLKLPNILHCL